MEIQTDHRVPTRRSLCLVFPNKNLSSSRFCLSGKKHRVKESEKRDKKLAEELKKMWNMKITVVSIIAGALG